MTGSVKSLIKDKGYGFIAVEGENSDLFFHRNSVEGDAFDTLEVGNALSFDREEGPKGPNAVNVRIV